MMPRVVILLVVATATTAAAAQANKKLLSALKQQIGGACTKKCGANYVCEVQRCEVCVPEVSCNTLKCGPGKKCEERPTGPVCVQLTCDDIRCDAGEICNELPTGPDCVPDVPSCEGFFCKRGTNCYVRNGSPICLPNTCEIRKCEHGLTCIDTPNGALCRRGKKKRGCKNKYCPDNSKCVETKSEGAHCAKI